MLELVEGPTLADRIAKGPIPLDEALPIAKQIAEALEGAHEAGVIHRDLKPANIKVREDGTVKVFLPEDTPSRLRRGGRSGSALPLRERRSRERVTSGGGAMPGSDGFRLSRVDLDHLVEAYCAFRLEHSLAALHWRRQTIAETHGLIAAYEIAELERLYAVSSPTLPANQAPVVRRSP